LVIKEGSRDEDLERKAKVAGRTARVFQSAKELSRPPSFMLHNVTARKGAGMHPRALLRRTLDLSDLLPKGWSKLA
jgi:hypothetical protein